ncbi:MAG: YbaB/EbfC family nucleoid-associated protein [Coriobacteriales bacterium]|jgi:DNA-binding YbaB/EbfC family protein|nr:YbaB/EbfC family nucleoid-associated protein [Coriobacteriales bacterium]
MDMNKMMKQARKMQAELNRVQEEVAELECEASSGGGAVSVVVGGDQSVKSIKIDPAAVDPEDTELLEDMILTAVNEALRTSQELAAEKMNAVTGGLGLPGF